MAVPIYDTLAHYATPPNSYIGASIFLSYIVLALYATLSITFSLYTQYTAIYHEPAPAKNEKLKAARSARARHIKIYAFLASLSFATLSYHMLFFLITHYFAWTGDKTRSLSGVSGQTLKKWMLESTLFQNFASELVQDVPNALWTQIAILGTWFWNVWMAQKASSRPFQTPLTLPFILLSQILPISFTVCLFIIQLHLSAPDIHPTPPTPNPPSPTKPIASLHIPNILLNAILLALPSLRHNRIFSPMVLVERFILLLPHSGLINLRKSDVSKCVYIASGFLVANGMRGRKEAGLGDVGAALRDGGFAIKALGWDAVLGGTVYGLLSWGGGV
ncbi:hypothetical protein CC86DRAFT_352572 [Ophiobolus disseminans]|uniref:Uncharacterized protein n=1 Tax=Ophiobolus disseminans TaxID=1469910 RepID=A0A6A6ZW11_9PLEO|nr:hypothetical protein CC86DRAFT_352572 [Ophiobolus disseminans]